jgi:hypothetical protein
MKLERNLTVGSTCAEGEANLRFARLWANTFMARPEHSRKSALIMTTPTPPHHHTHINLLKSTKLSKSTLIDVGVLQEVAARANWYSNLYTSLSISTPYQSLKMQLWYRVGKGSSLRSDPNDCFTGRSHANHFCNKRNLLYLRHCKLKIITCVSVQWWIDRKRKI